jgi:hypothetical protein
MKPFIPPYIMNFQPIKILTNLPLNIIGVNILQIGLNFILYLFNHILRASQHTQRDFPLIQIQNDRDKDQSRNNVSKDNILSGDKNDNAQQGDKVNDVLTPTV